MENLRNHTFRANLIESITALGKVQRRLESDPSRALLDARRLAKTLQTSGQRNGFPQITAAAVPVTDAPAQVVPRLLARLVRILEEVVSSGWDEKINILIVEGFGTIGRELREKLQAPNREVIITRTAASAEELLAEEDIALVVMDLVLPDVDGRNLLASLRASPHTEAIPIVVLASAGEPELQAECFALGADQFFQISSDIEMLAVAIASTLHRSLQNLRDTHRDAMTSLLNRDGLRRRLQRTLAKASRKNAEVSFALLDLHPAYVDNPGAPLTDYSAMVVSQVARVVGGVLRPRDTLARWRELELAIVFPLTDRGDAERALDRVREVLNAKAFKLGTRSFRVEFSSGLVQLSGNVTLEEAVAESNLILLSEKKKREFDERRAPSRPKQRILVIDYDQQIEYSLRRRMPQDAFDVKRVQDRDAAVSAVVAGHTALILLDSQLPGGDSFKLLTELRTMSDLDRVPILMMGVLGREFNVARAFETGADDYVMKPCPITELVARIRRHLKRTKQLATSLAPPGRAGSIAGLFSGDQLYEFVQMLGLNSKTGRLRLNGILLSGHIDFRAGKVIGAWTSQGDEALKATHSLLIMQSGKFEFWPDLESPAEQQGILANVDNLLLDALRLRDEARRPE